MLSSRDGGMLSSCDGSGGAAGGIFLNFGLVSIFGFMGAAGGSEKGDASGWADAAGDAGGEGDEQTMVVGDLGIGVDAAVEIDAGLAGAKVLSMSTTLVAFDTLRLAAAFAASDGAARFMGSVD